VQSQIPYSARNPVAFRDISLDLQPGTEQYLIRSHSTIASWVDEEYQRARQSIKFKLQFSLSRVHFIFDIWASPACGAIIDIYVHLLAPDLCLKHALISLKEMKGAPQGETIAEVVGDLMQWFGLDERLRVFVGDDATSIDTAVRALVRRFKPNLSGGRLS
jgi:hypothetical protein